MSQFQVLKGLCREERETEIWKVCDTLSERRNLHAYLEKKAELAVQGECVAQKRLSEAEAEMGHKNLGSKKCWILPCMKPIENSNLRVWSFIRRINGQIRLKEKRLIHFGEIGNEKHNLPRKSRKEIAAKLTEFRRICCEETEPDS